MLNQLATTMAILVWNRCAGFKLDKPLADCPSVPIKGFFCETLAAIPKEPDDLSHKTRRLLPRSS